MHLNLVRNESAEEFSISRAIDAYSQSCNEVWIQTGHGHLPYPYSDTQVLCAYTKLMIIDVDSGFGTSKCLLLCR
jgi:hypothetical protein